MMKIDRTKRLDSFRTDFQARYPGLDIKFYKKIHGVNEGSDKAEEWDLTKTFEEINPSINNGTCSVDDQMTIAAFEGQLEKSFGLHAQVFRRSNDLWLQTTSTDQWTLKKQNEKGLHSVQSPIDQ